MIIVANKTITVDVDPDLKYGYYLVERGYSEELMFHGIYVVIEKLQGNLLKKIT